MKKPDLSTSQISAGTGYWNLEVFTSDINYYDTYQGGIVFRLFQPGEPGYVAGEKHGLIAAPSDQSTGIQWWNGSNVTTDATAINCGTGLSNTNKIVTIQRTGSYAAKLCFDLILNGYNDWYLPSDCELESLYNYQNEIGGFSGGYYWSSTESVLTSPFGSSRAESKNFSTGVHGMDYKSNTCSIRAIRTF